MGNWYSSEELGDIKPENKELEKPLLISDVEQKQKNNKMNVLDELKTNPLFTEYEKRNK